MAEVRAGRLEREEEEEEGEGRTKREEVGGREVYKNGHARHLSKKRIGAPREGNRSTSYQSYRKGQEHGSKMGEARFRLAAIFQHMKRGAAPRPLHHECSKMAIAIPNACKGERG